MGRRGFSPTPHSVFLLLLMLISFYHQHASVLAVPRPVNAIDSTTGPADSLPKRLVARVDKKGNGGKRTANDSPPQNRQANVQQHNAQQNVQKAQQQQQQQQRAGTQQGAQHQGVSPHTLKGLQYWLTPVEYIGPQAELAPLPPNDPGHGWVRSKPICGLYKLPDSAFSTEAARGCTAGCSCANGVLTCRPGEVISKNGPMQGTDQQLAERCGLKGGCFCLGSTWTKRTADPVSPPPKMGTYRPKCNGSFYRMCAGCACGPSRPKTASHDIGYIFALNKCHDSALWASFQRLYGATFTNVNLNRWCSFPSAGGCGCAGARRTKVECTGTNIIEAGVDMVKLCLNSCKCIASFAVTERKRRRYPNVEDGLSGTSDKSLVDCYRKDGELFKTLPKRFSTENAADKYCRYQAGCGCHAEYPSESASNPSAEPESAANSPNAPLSLDDSPTPAGPSGSKHVFSPGEKSPGAQSDGSIDWEHNPDILPQWKGWLKEKSKSPDGSPSGKLPSIMHDFSWMNDASMPPGLKEFIAAHTSPGHHPQSPHGAGLASPPSYDLAADVHHQLPPNPQHPAKVGQPSRPRPQTPAAAESTSGGSNKREENQDDKWPKPATCSSGATNSKAKESWVVQECRNHCVCEKNGKMSCKTLPSDTIPNFPLDTDDKKTQFCKGILRPDAIVFSGRVVCTCKRVGETPEAATTPAAEETETQAEASGGSAPASTTLDKGKGKATS